jgi:hypothetical protein
MTEAIDVSRDAEGPGRVAAARLALRSRLDG